MRINSLEELISCFPRRIYIEENLFKKIPDVLRWSFEIVKRCTPTSGPYLSLDYSGRSHCKFMLVDGEKRQRWSGNYMLKDISLRALLSSIRTYLTSYKFGEYADVYELKIKTAELHSGVSPSRANEILKNKRIFDRTDDRVRLRFPINELKLTDDCIFRSSQHID